VIEQVQERGFAPLDVVEHQDQRSLAGHRLVEAADRPEGLLSGARVGDPHEL
jgi:hypothetical protein